MTTARHAACARRRKELTTTAAGNVNFSNDGQKHPGDFQRPAETKDHHEHPDPNRKHQTRPRTQKAFRGTELLVGGYLAISVLTLVGVVLLRNHRGVARARELGLIP